MWSKKAIPVLIADTPEPSMTKSTVTDVSVVSRLSELHRTVLIEEAE
jgi:hypothetical protein